MNTHVSFRASLFVSLIIHMFIFFSLPYFRILPQRKAINEIEINYYRFKSESLAHQIPKKFEEKIQHKKIQSLRTQKAPPPFLKEDLFIKKKVNILNKPISVTKGLPERKVSLPAVETSQIHSPTYLNYYQGVREKIKDRAYQNYTRLEKGEVYLTFVLSSNGYLRDIRLIEEKSTPNSFLKEIALRSIKDASPFPVFPKELDYPQLTFNVIISFEIGD